MRLFSIAWKDFMVYVTDKRSVALIVLMPIVLILVLGVCLSTVFNNNGINIESFKVAVVDKDKNQFSAQFIEFLKSEDIKKLVTVIEIPEAEARDRVSKGKIPALIVLPEGYSNAIHEDREAKMELYLDPGDAFKGKIVESLVKSYSGVTAAVHGASDAADTVFKGYGLNGNLITPAVIKTINEIGGTDFAESTVQKKQSLSAMQYYSAGILVMYILFVGMLGTISVIEEREQRTLLRLMSTTVSRGVILSGKLLGLYFLGVFDVAVLILFTKFVFGVDWGNSIPGLVVLSGAMIFAACGLSMLIASLMKTARAVGAVNPVIVMLLSMLGGSMMPLFVMPPVMQTISKITLNNWALNGYISLMFHNGFQSIVTPSLVLCGMGCIFLTIGIMRLKLY